MSDDLTDFGKPATVCKVARLLAEMTDEQRTQATNALAADEWKVPSQRIADVLHRWGYAVSNNSVTRHRRSLCCCSR